MSFYNKIIEEPTRFVLLKNPTLPAAGQVKVNDMTIEWGKDGDKAKFKQLIYNKPAYDRAAVEAIAQKTVECPWCIKGKTLGEMLQSNQPWAPQLAMQFLASQIMDQFAKLQTNWKQFWGIK